MSTFCLAMLSLSLAAAAGAADYYLSADGDDARDGLSPERSWRSLARVPVANLKPGDRVLLRGGDAFHGSLALTVSGSQDRPITIASYGTGRATVLPPVGADGIRIADAGWIVVRDLDLRGPGADAGAKGIGIHLEAKERRSSGNAIRDVSCADFPIRGIELSCAAVGAGFDDVLVERADCSGSGEGGMGSWGPVKGDAYSYRRLTVRDSVFHGNRGRPAKKDNHSGNGIILGDCQNALIERCAAWGNGDLCNSGVGGPVGIWLCESDRSVIRGCVSFRNRTGKNVPDGGGFDLDGGCTGCVIEDCLSWRNDGAGYLVCQYDGARPLHDNVIRNCWSIGDGRAKNNGAIFVIGAMERTLVENCTLIVDPSPTQAACWRVFPNSRALQLRNNVCIALDGAPLFPDARTGDTTFGGNRWWPPKGFELPAGDAALDATALASIPAAIDEVWLASLPSATGQPATVDASWDAVLNVARCEGRQSRIGASAQRRYGPAPR